VNWDENEPTRLRLKILSRALQRLPETAAELQEVAKNRGGPPKSIHLRQAASETMVKRAGLADY
jgi:hypothetical protein